MNKEKPSFIKKQFERAIYLFLLFSLAIGALVATILTYLSFLIPEKKQKKDFLFFPYAPKNNIGSISRFQIFLPFLERDGYTYDIDYLYDEKYYLSITLPPENRIKQYLLLHRIFWHRLFKTLTAGNYKAVFIQRAMFPEYYGQTFSYLERLMSKLNDNVTIDFYDAEYARNKKLTDSSVSFCDKVCVVNKHLYQYFSKIHNQVYYNNLAVDASHYLIKEKYTLHNPVKIFWTGSVVNAQNLKNIIPILEKINKEIPLKLLMICPTNAGYTSPIIERLNWEKDTFFKYLADADIAIYPALEDTEFSRGKVAFKTMEYFSTKVPVIASPLGLSHYFEDGKDVLVASSNEEWEAAFRKLIADEPLRKEMVGNAYQKLMQYHNVDATYENFVKILLTEKNESEDLINNSSPQLRLKNPPFIYKQIERAVYLFLLCSLAVGAFTATVLTYFSFLIPKRKIKKKDFLFFPYSHKDNTANIARFQIYFPYFERDGYTYDIDYLYNEKYLTNIYLNRKSRAREYFLFHQIFWHRLSMALTAGNYKAIFINRSMFPEYYDQRFAYLERLMSKLNNNITIDFFDAEYVRNKSLVHSTISFCNKVSVVNKHLYEYFSKYHEQVFYNNLAINTSFYTLNQSEELHQPVRIFWTGSIGNSRNLKTLIPILEKINQETPLKFVMVCKTNGGYTNTFIEHHTWDKNTFFSYLADSDIALYPAWDDTELSRGKVAYKVLDYVASKVPVVASPFGLPQDLQDKKDVLVAHNEADWEAGIRELINNKSLRKELAENAYQKILKYHSVEEAYKNFLKILLS